MSESNVIPFRNPDASRDPDAPWTGERREAALVAYRALAPVAALEGVSRAFRALSRMPECRGLGASDVLPIFVDAFRCVLARMPEAIEANDHG